MKKTSILSIFIAFCCLFFAVPNASAVVSSTNGSAISNAVLNQNEQLSEKQTKKFEKLQKKMNKKAVDIDFKDPVKKWLWYSLFLWGGSIVLSILFSVLGVGGLWAIASLVGLAGTVCFVIWLIKKFG